MAKATVKPQFMLSSKLTFSNFEWDAGSLPASCVYRSVRISVRKTLIDDFVVYALGRKGNTQLAENVIGLFQCDGCAKAFALCIVYGGDYAECEIHSRNAFGEREIFDGMVSALCAAMGITETRWTQLDDGARHRVLWVAREIVDGKLEFGDALALWEQSEKLDLPLRAKVSDWFAALSLRRSQH